MAIKPEDQFTAHLFYGVEYLGEKSFLVAEGSRVIAEYCDSFYRANIEKDLYVLGYYTGGTKSNVWVYTPRKGTMNSNFSAVPYNDRVPTVIKAYANLIGIPFNGL